MSEIIDTWYENKMTEYTDKIEDTIYCNDRSIIDLGGWNTSSPINNFIIKTNTNEKKDGYCSHDDSIGPDCKSTEPLCANLVYQRSRSYGA